MNAYKEFEGKTLDEAIGDACAFYDTAREKLEIEILNDSTGGIFGLVGAKKARIRARMVRLANVLEELDSPAGKNRHKKESESASGDTNGGKRETRESSPRENPPRENPPRENPPRERSPRGERAESERKQPFPPPMPDDPEFFGQASVAELFARNSTAKPAKPHRDRNEQKNRRPRGENGRDAVKAKQAAQADESSADVDADVEADVEELSRVPLDQLDAAELEAAVREIVCRLTEPFLGPVTLAVTIGSDRVRVSISDVEDSGLLIGRDGQTLASLQYLVTRMLSGRMKTMLRVQIDAGDYRERQDERLRELALSLAEKVKTGGRPQVTRPLSSYHRRVIHVTLQDDPLVQTHSKGEGELKRVMVARKRPEKGA